MMGGIIMLLPNFLYKLQCLFFCINMRDFGQEPGFLLYDLAFPMPQHCPVFFQHVPSSSSVHFNYNRIFDFFKTFS